MILVCRVSVTLAPVKLYTSYFFFIFSVYSALFICQWYTDEKRSLCCSCCRYHSLPLSVFFTVDAHRWSLWMTADFSDWNCFGLWVSLTAFLHFVHGLFSLEYSCRALVEVLLAVSANRNFPLWQCLHTCQECACFQESSAWWNWACRWM